MIDKKLVQKNFDRGSREYDEYAHIQKEISKKLSLSFEGSEEEIKILEIGPGTGFLSEVLIEKFPKAKIEFIDISLLMLEKLSQKIGKEERFSYLHGDIEELELENKYDYIFSSACFQWINDFDRLLERLKNTLNKNGKLIFSTFGKETFLELDKILKEEFPSIKVSQDFLSDEEIKNKVSKRYFIELVENQNKREYYNDLFDFFKYVKKIGANCALEKRKTMTKSQLLKLKDIYIKSYSQNGKVYFNNNIIYIKAIKE